MSQPLRPTDSSASEISQDHWSRFFDEFSKDHQGERARVEVSGIDTQGAHELCREMPFIGVTYSTKDRPDLIEIILEQSPDGANLTHVVERPAHVWHYSHRGHSTLQIESTDGVTTWMQLA
jgi:hypothetical protein